MTIPFWYTVTVRQTSLPSTGYSIRFWAPGASAVVYWTLSLAGRTFRTTGAPMTYLYGGKQYIVVATGWKDVASELVALALPN